MKETFYFSHDYNAQHDEKIIKLMSKFGWEGYGLYWGVIERLYESDGYLEYDCDTLAFGMRTQSERIKSLIEDFDLFKVSNKKFFSNSVLARLRQRKGKSELARQSAFQRWNKPKESNANAKRTQSDGYAIKVKESKVKESKLLLPEAEQSSQENKEINLIIDEFYKVNPTISFVNCHNRNSSRDLIKKFGVEKAVAMIQWHQSKMGDKYCPTATTPTAFKEKLGDISVYANKLKNNPLVNDLGSI